MESSARTLHNPDNIDQDCDGIASLMGARRMYRPEYTMQWIYDVIQKHGIDAESKALQTEGHKEILQSESDVCYKLNTYVSLNGRDILKKCNGERKISFHF